MKRARKRNQNKIIPVSKGAGLLLLAYVIGNAVQLVLHAVCIDFWESWQIPFCAAGGFLFAVAILSGMIVAGRDVDVDFDVNPAETHYEDMQK